uniref:Immunoglobulin V-set domain-containing protein n=1 Tax=Amphilophus citrinellus TaxID=61819 RepID=A0A3Q0S1V8_AMPCI
VLQLRLLGSISYTFYSFQNHSLSVNFEQSSARVVNKGTKELRIDCSHDDSSLAAMLWYQQSAQSMSLIGFTVLQGEPTYENHFKDRFQIIRNNTMKGCLIIRNLSLSDSAVYLCATLRELLHILHVVIISKSNMTVLLLLLLLCGT